MARKYLPLRGDGKEYRLRLTVGGQRNLRERFQEETLQTVLLAAGDSERLCALLGEALSWPGSGNDCPDGEQFLDLLVDWGYQGQARFGALAFDLAAASGLLTAEQAGQLKGALRSAVEQAYTRMETPETAEAEQTAAPFPRA
ncbi:MAG: hypothetical protein LUG47_07485 [Clostridiales bacterium]|nr:hypothetical protein [Clostridiales bacterium]